MVHRKSFPTFCPLGPAIVTADEIADPHQLAIFLTIDGETLQHSNTRELVFKIPELIEYISSITPLLPGDIVSTGTPPASASAATPSAGSSPVKPSPSPSKDSVHSPILSARETYAHPSELDPATGLRAAAKACGTIFAPMRG